jgi:hypothetical protein
MRKAFNFYRSYWDVANELNDKDRLAFYDALLTRQFTGKEIELTGISKFAYISQKHSIDAQIKGYEDKTKQKINIPIEDPTQGGTQGGIEAPSVQEKEKGKGKEEYIDFQALLEFINSCFGRNFRIMNNSIKDKYKSLLKQGYTKLQITDSINNCKNNEYHKQNNYLYCTPEFFSRSVIIDKYSNVSKTDNSKVYSPNIIHE